MEIKTKVASPVRKSRILSVVALILVVGVLVIGRDHIAAFFSDDDKPPVSTAALEKEFKEIPVRPGDQIADFKTFDKRVITGATAHVWSSAMPSEVVAYYVGVLPALGWMQSPGSPNREGEVKFCKAGTSLQVQASMKDNRTYYYLGLVRTQYKASDSFCE